MAKKIQVAIIESRSDDDHWEGRSEGQQLAHLLKMQGVGVKFREVTSLKTLQRAIRECDKDGVTYVHLSCHGSPEGIALTDGVFVSWSLLDELAWPTLKGRCLAFSSCNVATGVERLFQRHKTLCNGVVAATREITWAEGLVAFSVFYHLAGQAGATEDDVELMNGIVGKGTFVVVRGSRKAATTYMIG